MTDRTISHINIFADTDILNDIVEKYTTNGDLDFDKICPIPKEIKDTPCFSNVTIQALSRYLSIINPDNKAYEGHPIRQKYPAISSQEMTEIFEDLENYGDTGLVSLLALNLPPYTEGEPLYVVNGLKIYSADGTPDNFIDQGKQYIDNIRKYKAPNAEKWMERFWGSSSGAKTITKCEIVDNMLSTRIETKGFVPHKIISILSKLYPSCTIVNNYATNCDDSRYMKAAYESGALVYDKDYPEFNN